MEFIHKSPLEIRSSFDGSRISNGFISNKIILDNYTLDEFWKDLFLFVTDNTSILSLSGSFQKEILNDYFFSNFDSRNNFLSSLIELDKQMPYAVDNIIADILLHKGMEDGRSNLNRYTYRDQTTAGMFDQSVVDKSELMFL